MKHTKPTISFLKKINAYLKTKRAKKQISIIIKFQRCMEKYISQGDIKKTKKMLSKIVPKYPILEFQSPLMLAAKYGQIDIVRFLVENGESVNKKDLCTAIFYASDSSVLEANIENINIPQNAHSQVIKYLAEKGADLNVINNSGKTALMEALEWGNLESAKALLSQGADPNIKSIKAIRNRYSDVITIEERVYGLTALMIASEHGPFEMVQLLLSYGANVFSEDNQGENSLAKAIQGGNKKIVDSLLDYAEEYSKESKGICLIMASYKGDYNTVKRLIENNADVNSGGNDSYPTPLINAVRFGHLDIVNLLLEKGADVNAFSCYIRDNARGTALLTAVQNYNLDIAKLLIKNGANTSINDFEGDLICLASSRGYLEIVSLCITNGQNINSGHNNFDWKTLICDSYLSFEKHNALIFATQGGHIEIVRYLLENGADVNATNIFGTALDYALRYKHPEIAELLIASGAKSQKK